MSIYNPPTQDQTIFNPTNFGTTAETTIDEAYLDQNYLSFPVAQGTQTLVDTIIQGNITQTGNINLTGNLVVGSTNVITELTSLDTRLDAEEPKTTALQTLTESHTEDILTKQDLITSATDLECNSLTTGDLEVNGNITKKTYFDTIVVRRPTGVSGVGSDRIGVKELQCWVNGVNIMTDNGLTSYFASWLDKDTDTGPQNVATPSTLAHNNSLEDLGALSTGSEGLNSALIIKNIPTTSIHNIQAIVFYSRDSNDTLQTAVGLGIELYNSTNDPNLITPLASTPVITATALLVYRYDFPSIDTYTDFVGVNSISNIVNNTFAFTQVIVVISYTEITGDVVVAGDLTAENFVVGSTNVITELTSLDTRLDEEELKTTALQTLTESHTDDITANTADILTKQATITDGSLTIARTDGLQTALNAKQATITDGSLTIARTSGLQTALNAKQATITTSTSLSLDILTATNIISKNTTGTGELTVEGLGLNYDAYLDLKNILRAQVLTTLDGGWYRIRSGGGSTNIGILSFEKLSPVDGSLLLTPLSILNNGDIVAQKNLYVGQNTGDTTTKSIFFGGTLGDNTYLNTVIENRIYEVGIEKSELLLFKGNDVEGVAGADRIRLRGANIVFDTYPIASTTRTDENIRMTILSNGNVGIGTTTPTALLDVNGDVLVAGDVTAENLIVGSTNVITEIGTKQATLNDNVDITTGTIGSGNITGRVGSTITAPTITASTSLLYGTTNVETKITEIEDTLETTSRLNNANVFTANQEIEGSLKATFVSVTNTTPIQDSHLTSRFYVDSLVQTRVREVEDEIVILTATQTEQTSQSSSQSQSIIDLEELTVTHTSDIFDLEVGKQATITDGSLTIARTDGLQTALDSKQATITDGSLTIARTDGLQTTLTDILSRLTALENA